jgi:hypothetical protein
MFFLRSEAESSADFQSAVSQDFILQTDQTCQTVQVNPLGLTIIGDRIEAWSPACRRTDYARLKYCTARSCFSAAFRVEKVPRLRRLPVRGLRFRE